MLSVVIAVLQKQGILRDAFFWTITAHANPHVFWGKGALSILAFLGCCFPLVIGAILSLRGKRGLWSENSAERTAVLILLAASAIGAAAGGRFYPHYYIQLIPPLALLAAPYYARIWSGRDQPRHWLLRPATSYALLVVTVIAFFIASYVGLASRRQATEAGRYLFENSAPDDRLFIWGHSSPDLFRVPTRPACRYILTFPLTGRVFGGVSPASTLVNGSCPARGTYWKRIFPSILPCTLSTWSMVPRNVIRCGIFPFWRDYWRNITDQSYKGAGELFIASMISHRFPSGVFAFHDLQ